MLYLFKILSFCFLPYDESSNPFHGFTRFQMPEFQGLVQEQNTPIDLCGLHVSEAIHALNYELNNRRKIARSTGRRLQVIIISSTRTPARLTAAVEQYLLEHGIQYTQAQPGLFRVLLQ
jgi:hypothetical protein